MPRARLANRRQNETMAIRRQGQEFTVTIGYDAEGRPAEVFANATKTGTELAHLIADACVIISLALQFGATPADLTRSLGTVPDPAQGEDAHQPASLLGEILELLVAARLDWPEKLAELEEKGT